MADKPKQSRAPSRHFRIVESICVCQPGGELAAAAEVIERIRRLALFHRPRQAYVFMDTDGCVFVFGIDRSAAQTMLGKHPEWLVGFYTHKATAEDIADDLAAMPRLQQHPRMV